MPATDLPAIYAGELDYIRQIEPLQEAGWSDGMYWHIKQWASNLERMFIAKRDAETSGYCFWEAHDDTAVLASIMSRGRSAAGDSAGDSLTNS